MIEVRDLSKSFGPVHAVRGLSFDVARGEILGFLGPNGAGKTTTMRMLTGYLTPSGGHATVAGLDVVEETHQVRRRLGYLAERNPLYVEMRVESYLHHRARLKSVPRRARQAAVDKVVEACGLEAWRHRIIDTLSKGYRQRVGLADALVHDPDVLILDEPTSGLDPNQVRGIRGFLSDWGRSRCIVLSTHILGEVSAICDRAVVISEGRKVADAPVAEIIELGAGDLERAFYELTSPAAAAAASASGEPSA